MNMKATQETPSPDWYIGGEVINLTGGELEVEAVENGYRMRTVEIIRGKDGENTRKFRHYVFNDSREMLRAIDFWTKKQEVAK